MRSLALFVVALVLGGCTVTYRNYPPSYGYANTGGYSSYSYAGEHPIPEGYGGGWCSVAAPHTHDYDPGGLSDFTYVDNTYIYPSQVTFYYDTHPIPWGGYCALGGRHSHPYGFGSRYSSAYAWDPGYNGYVFRRPAGWSPPPAPPPRSGWGRPAPPPGYSGGRPAPPPSGYSRPAPPPPSGYGSRPAPPSGSIAPRPPPPSGMSRPSGPPPPSGSARPAPPPPSGSSSPGGRPAPPPSGSAGSRPPPPPGR